MPGQRRVGMDHEHYDWSPLSRRGVLCWPEQARVAVCVLVNLEHTEWHPPEGSVQVVTSVGGLAARPFPDYTRLSHREYGHRVGIFRLLDVLEKHGLRRRWRWMPSPPSIIPIWCAIAWSAAARSSGTASQRLK